MTVVHRLSLAAVSRSYSLNKLCGLLIHSRALALGAWASVAIAHGPNYPVARGLFLDGVEPVSPALAGGFLTTGHQGKSQHFCFYLCPRAFLFSSIHKVLWQGPYTSVTCTLFHCPFPWNSQVLPSPDLWPLGLNEGQHLQ